MVATETKDKRARFVFFSSIATSIVLVSLFLLGAFLTNVSRGEVAYTQVDMAAGSIFVFVLSMIISLSLLPKIMDWLENKKKSKVVSK
jgi:membrane protein YdbS with pleckstrin-like domain